MKLSKKEEKRLRYRRNMPPRSRFDLDVEGAKLFAMAHPRLYPLVVVLQWLAFSLPLIAYALLTAEKVPLNGAWAVLSVAGALILGMGLASLVGALRRGCWGVVSTILFLGWGLTLLRTSLILQYHPTAADLIPEPMLVHYFATFFFLLIPLLFYGGFRDHIHKELRQTLRESEIRKWKKGMRNYWWYEEIQRQIGTAPQFGLNKAFTLSMMAAAGLHVLLGWNGYGATMTNEMLRILYTLLACMELVRCVQQHRRVWGRVVLLRRDKNGNWHSVIPTLLTIALLAFFVWLHTDALYSALQSST